MITLEQIRGFIKSKALTIVWIFLSLTIIVGGVWAFMGRGLTSSTPQEDRSFSDYLNLAKTFKEPALYQAQDSTVTFLAFGDVSLSRNIAFTIDKQNDELFPFRGIEELLLSSDFNFANLETPFSSSDAYTAKETLVFNAPKKNVAGLKYYNFQVLSLANNHSMDQGLDGIRITRELLSKNNILHSGTGETLEEAWQPAIINKNGIAIGFVSASYSSINDGGQKTNNYVARIQDQKRLSQQIRDLKNKVDFVISSMHAGTEYTTTPNLAQINFAHSALDAGADLVIGHHPHWIQDKEVYCPASKASRIVPANQELIFTQDELENNCKAIYYSLGNFVFDQSWSEQTKKGLALKITLTKQQTSCHPELLADTLGESMRAGDSGSSTAVQDTNISGDTDCAFNIQPANSPTPTPRIQIQEIPIYIDNNCCPVIK